MSRGGSRIGAGRKKLSGLYQEPTKPVRLPIRHIETVKKFLDELYKSFEPRVVDTSIKNLSMTSLDFTSVPLPFFSSAVSAGFPSPADDYVDAPLDLNQYLIHHPSSTFFVRVNGDSMINAGIQHDDVLVVDRSLTPKHNDVVIAVLNSELTVKRLIKEGHRLALKPENPKYPITEITSDDAFNLWGVVTSVVHRFR